jgi:magnesium-transporting ATPase (P-type)
MVTGDNLETARAVAKQSLIIPQDHMIFDIWGWKRGENQKDAKDYSF